MAAVPKKKPSKTRHRQKHSAWRSRQTSQIKPTVKCSHCGEPKFPHKVCKECGYYRGRLVVEPKTKVSKPAKE